MNETDLLELARRLDRVTPFEAWRWQKETSALCKEASAAIIAFLDNRKTYLEQRK